MVRKYSFLLLMLALLSVTACVNSRIETRCFGELADGTNAKLFRLSNKNGAYVELTDFGARIVSIVVPDASGKMGDVVLGYDNISGYENDRVTYAGATLGRYANRIADGKFEIEGVKYVLSVNEQRNGRGLHLHGGFEGFDRKIWSAEQISDAESAAIRFTRISPDGEEGYAGNLDCSVTYCWTDDNVLRVTYEAATDATTIVNLSNHVYFNLRGASAGNIMEHMICINSKNRVTTDMHFLADGMECVEGTPFDFRHMHRLGDAVDTMGISIFDKGSLNWYVDGYDGCTLRCACVLFDQDSGRRLDIFTTEPGLLVYPCSGFVGTIVGKGGHLVQRFAAVALETQHFPDTPNRPEFPQCVLYPGERFCSVTEYRFGIGLPAFAND